MHNEWRVVFSKDAESDLATLDRPVRRRVIEKIEWLELNFKLIVPQTLRADRAGNTSFEQEIGGLSILSMM